MIKAIKRYVYSKTADYVDVSIFGLAIGYLIGAVIQSPKPSDPVYLAVGIVLWSLVVLNTIPVLVLIVDRFIRDRKGR